MVYHCDTEPTEYDIPKLPSDVIIAVAGFFRTSWRFRWKIIEGGCSIPMFD